MQLLSLLAVSGLATASPILSVAESISASSQCGYVRFSLDSSLISGVYANQKCLLVHPQQPNLQAHFYKIDQTECQCEFYTSKQSCEQRDDVPNYMGQIEGLFTEKVLYSLCAPK